MTVEYKLFGSWAESQDESASIVEPGQFLSIDILNGRILHLICDADDLGGEVILSDPRPIMGIHRGKSYEEMDSHYLIPHIIYLIERINLDEGCSTEVRDGGNLVAEVKHIPPQQ